jgi:hypothetical protein
MRTTIRTKSYYSRNNFVCHLEQKHCRGVNASLNGRVMDNKYTAT